MFPADVNKSGGGGLGWSQPGGPSPLSTTTLKIILLHSFSFQLSAFQHKLSGFQLSAFRFSAFSTILGMFWLNFGSKWVILGPGTHAKSPKNLAKRKRFAALPCCPGLLSYCWLDPGQKPAIHPPSQPPSLLAGWSWQNIIIFFLPG